MFATLWAALSSPEIIAAISDIVVTLLTMFLGVALPMISARLYRWIGVRIEEKHQKALHEAIVTWAENAMKRGVKTANHEAYEDLLAYLRQSVPDALKALGPSAEVLVRLATRYLGAKT